MLAEACIAVMLILHGPVIDLYGPDARAAFEEIIVNEAHWRAWLASRPCSERHLLTVTLDGDAIIVID